MAKLPTPFVQHILEMMSEWSEVRARSMFGGWGIYADGTMFALVADDVLYLKADDENRAAFVAQSLEPFVYQSNGKATTISYYRAPDEAFDDREVMAHWAQIGLEAAARKRRKAR